MTRPISKRKVILGAIKLLKKGWTQGAFARNLMGRSVKPTSKAAVEWCAEGALIASCGGDLEGKDEAWAAFYHGAGIGIYQDATRWNDKQKSVEPVLRAMRKALRGER